MGYRECPDYRKQVQRVAGPVCEAGGLPQRAAGLCLDCKAAVPPNRRMPSWLVFDDPNRHAQHSLKYRRNIALGDALAPYLVEFVTALGWPVDVVVPIPLVKNRTKERGYNQAALVAMPQASIQPWRYMPRAFSRDHGMRIPVGLTITQPRENVRGAYSAPARHVRGKTIWLRDEIATAEATLAGSAGALLDSGAGSIYGLRLARALGAMV